MLKPAILYGKIIKECLIEGWYDERYKYLSSTTGHRLEEISDNNIHQHQFVSLNSVGDILGFIAYRVFWDSLSCSDFIIVNFCENNITFAKDMYQVIKDIFCKYHLNSLSFMCIADNPAIKIYRKYIKKHGGSEVGTIHDYVKLIDGELHDMVYFEILARDWSD